MFRIESNATDVFLNLRKSFDYADANLEENLRRGAVDSVAIIAHRIQQQGESVTGRLATRAMLRMGAYSKQYAKRRAERGRQIEQVDLTNDGDLMRNWNVLSTSPKEAVVGFLSNQQAEIAGHLEDYYGEEIFNLSDKEQTFVVEGITDRLMDDLKYSQ